MNTNRLLRLALLFAGLLPTLLTAQIDRESNQLVNYQHLRHATMAEVAAVAANGYRVSSFEVYQQSPLMLNVSMVRNVGVYQANWLFYADKTAAELWNLCQASNARVVQLDRYEVNGQERLAALLFVNTGQQQKAWHWYWGLTEGTLWSTVSGIGHRIIDLEPYMDNGVRKYHVVTIANTGSDQKPWWVYTNVTPATAQAYMDLHDARLYDFELKSAFLTHSCACVLVRDDITSLTLWGQFYGTGFNSDDERGGRVIMTGFDNLTSHVITLLDNRNPFQTYGVGCVGSHGQSVQRGEGNAMTGTQVQYTADHLWPWTIAIWCYSDSTTWFPLAPLGAPGCSGYMLPFATTNHFANASGIATATLQLPANPALQGAQLVTQVAALDPPLNDLGLQVSNALVTTMRHW